MSGPRHPVGTSVLVVAADGPVGQSWLHAMEAATIEVEWARSIAELQARAARGDLRTPELVFLDLELPDAAGEDLVSLARACLPLATIIVLAAELSGEHAARLLSQGVPSLTKPISPLALTGLALRLSRSAPPKSSVPAAPWLRSAPASADLVTRTRGTTQLKSLVASYSVDRVLSRQQRIILRMYLEGMNDKEIAQLCRCTEATVYEHWRRMARKAGGSQKGDVISDFYRFLGTD